MSAPVIIADKVKKTYPGVKKGEAVGVGPVEPLSFEVRRDEIFGIIGPDGAGKTTLFRLMTSLLVPESGTLTVLGYDTIKDYRQIRKHVGYMPGVFSLYPDLSIRENLNFFATLFGTTVEENYDLIRQIYVQIEPFKDRKARNLSGGMKQKLALCCALVHKPEILFLDEPTTGIDPISRVDLWDMLRNLSGQGVSIVVSTAYMDEAKRCDRIAFMLDGRFLAVDEPANFERNYPLKLLAVRGNDRLKLIERLRAFPGTHSCYAFGETLHLAAEENVQPEEVLAYLETLHPEAKVYPIDPTIEDAFIHLSCIEE